MKKILAVFAVALLSMGAQAQIPAANVTGGPKNATPIPEAHKRAIRAQQREDDKKLEAEQAAQKKLGKSTTVETVEGQGRGKNLER